MTDLTNALDNPTPPVATPVADTVLSFELPGVEGTHTLDCATVPGNIRLDFLKSAVRSYIANRVNAAAQRHAKDDAVKAWNAFDEASKADPLQSLVAKPSVERPAAPDLKGTMDAAIADLLAGNVRKQGTGVRKPRERVDPLVQFITRAVVKDVFDRNRETNPKYTYPMATKEVGKDGLAYLNTLIDTKAAAGVDRAQLEKMRDTKYVNPAKLMLGLNDTKAMKELPSIL